MEEAVACLAAVLQRADGRALTPIYTWADTRPAQAVLRLRRHLDERAVHARTGCPLHASYWPAKLAWLRRCRPELFGQVRHWMSPGEYLHLRLFGAPLCSVSMASGTGLFDPIRLDWDDELLGALSVDRAQLSPLADLESLASGLLAPWRDALPRHRRLYGKRLGNRRR